MLRPPLQPDPGPRAGALPDAQQGGETPGVVAGRHVPPRGAEETDPDCSLVTTFPRWGQVAQQVFIPNPAWALPAVGLGEVTEQDTRSLGSQSLWRKQCACEREKQIMDTGGCGARIGISK